jgi:hypothetical protein
MTLSMATYLASDSNPITAPTGAAMDQGSVTLSFQTDTSSFTCPSFTDIYTPGDGQILLDTSRFYLNQPSVGDAPLGNVIVVAQEQTDKTAGAPLLSPVMSSNYSLPGVNSLVISNQYDGSPAKPFNGFLDSSYEGEHTYNISFLMQDMAGVVSPPPSSPSCIVSPVQTTNVRGFLKESSCFIATAAFSSAESEPVLMLRKFRDQILLKSEGGKGFVSWYYAWSPSAAEWILDHPVFRLPVLLLLIPLEIMAWFCLHSFWLVLYLSCSFIAGIYLISLVFAKTEGELDES